MKKVVIFGTGAAGRAIYRSIKSRDEIVCFIDNSIQKINTFYNGVKIVSPNDLKTFDFDVVAIGGVWANEMRDQLLRLGLSQNKIELIEDKDINYFTKNRAETTNYYIKILTNIFSKNNFKYLIEGSGLLSLLRGKDLSVASDIDIVLLDYKNLVYLAETMPKIFPELNINVVYFKQDSIVRKKGDVFKIIASDNGEEKMVLDINVHDKYKKFYVLPSSTGKYFYTPEKLFNELIDIDYLDFTLKIPKKYDEYLSLVYGKNYMEIPKLFSINDYGNLVDFDTLNKM